MEIVPALGHVRLSDLRRRHVDRFVREMLRVPRQDGFCDVTIASDGLTLIDDVRRDARVARRRLAQGASGARFYAGVPIHTWDGYRIGALCIYDRSLGTVGLSRFGGHDRVAGRRIAAPTRGRAPIRLAIAGDRARTRHPQKGRGPA